MGIEYLKYRQKQWEKKWQRAAELEAEREARREAEREAEARKQEAIVEHKRILLEQREAGRLRQLNTQRREKIAKQKWDEQLDTLFDQIENRDQKDDKLEEIRIIVQNREPSLQALGWTSWLSDPLNQRLADLDFEHAMEMFKRDNLMAKRRHGTRGSTKRFNYALSFVRTNEEYVTTEFDPIDYNLNQGFTVSFWVRPDELGGHRFAMGRRMVAAKGRFTFGLRNNSNLFVGVGNTKKTGFAHGFEVGTWYHLTITYAGNSASPKTLKGYIDGEEIFDTTTSWPDADNENGIPIYFGARNAIAVEGPNLGWSCGLDEVAIFDEVKDVSPLYNKGNPVDLGSESGLVGYWRFEEGKGTTVEDLSTNNNNGTLTTDDTGLPVWSKDTP